MKAQCERCKEIVPLQFSVAATAIRVRCPACAAEYTVEATDTIEAVPVPASTVPRLSTPLVPVAEAMTCPKCGEVQRKSDACRRCGLIIARWNPDSAASDPELGDAREAAALWKLVDENWSDLARHEAFIEHCRRSGVLAFAAARYRQSAARPGSAERLAQIRVVAEQSLAAVPRAAPAAKRSNLRTVLLAAVVAVLLVLIWVLISSAVGAARR